MTGRGQAEGGGPPVTGRDEVLARIRTALGDRPPGPDATIPRGYRAATGIDQRQLLDLLADRLHDYGCAVRRAAPDQLMAAVAAALADRGARRVVVPAGLGRTGLPDDIELVDGDGLSPAALDAADGVITGAAVAIAETGPIVLDGSAGQGRPAAGTGDSRGPGTARAGQVVGLVGEALARLDPARPLTWISGPSATSDIELDRVNGVHGPRTLEVILTEPA